MAPYGGDRRAGALGAADGGAPSPRGVRRERSAGRVRAGESGLLGRVHLRHAPAARGQGDGLVSDVRADRDPRRAREALLPHHRARRADGAGGARGQDRPVEGRPLEVEGDVTAPPAPPQVPEALATAIVPDPQLREAVIGDLAEDYRLIAGQRSVPTATLWYWSQLVRSAIPLAFLSLVGTGWRGWLRLGWAVLVGYATLATLVILSNAILA